MQIHPAAEPELHAVPADMQARFLRIAELLEGFGPRQVGMSHVRPLEGKLWEMRMQGRAGIVRGVYAAVQGRMLIVLHVFVKKTPTTPRAAIETAHPPGEHAMKSLTQIKAELIARPDVRAGYEALADEFAIARELISARARAGLSQAEVARRIGTTQSVVARLESGRRPPSLRTVQRYAQAVGAKAVLRIET